MNYRRLFIPNSIVFITVVTFERQEILIQNIDLLRYAIKQTKQKYKFDIVAICVLKNHIHMLFKTNNIKEYPDIIKNIKRNFSIDFDISQIPDYYESDSRKSKGEKSIWQRRYFEHTIINEEDLNKHIDYIHYNPMKHYNIAPKDCQYSSFNKFVEDGYYEKDWCNFENKYDINKLDYE